MNQVIPFNFDNRPVRTVMVDEAPWFIARDVCNILEIKNVSDTLKTKRIDSKGKEYVNFPENEKADIDTIYISPSGRGQRRKALCVNEPGLYRLIFQSRKPEAERLKTWVFTEVLPQIRKTGSWGTTLPDEVRGVIADIPLTDAVPAIAAAMRQDGCSQNAVWLALGVIERLLANLGLYSENERLKRRCQFTPDDEREILALHEAGYKVSQISDRTKKGRTRIKRTIEKAAASAQPGLFEGETMVAAHRGKGEAV
jgi:prophage antirepressor-like protein